MTTILKWKKIFVMPSVSYHKLTSAAKSFAFVGIISIFLFAMNGCNPALPNLQGPYNRGLGENPTRAKAGMRLIDPSWTCFRSINGLDEWLIDPTKQKAAVKVVKHDPSGVLLWEEDDYTSGRLFDRQDDPNIQEEIKLRYDYTSDRLSITYIGDDRAVKSWISGEATNNNGCLVVIDRVKKKWESRDH